MTARSNPCQPLRAAHIVVTALRRSLACTGQRPTKSSPKRAFSFRFYFIVLRARACERRSTTRLCWRARPLWPVGCREGWQGGQEDAFLGGWGTLTHF